MQMIEEIVRFLQDYKQPPNQFQVSSALIWSIREAFPVLINTKLLLLTIEYAP